MKKNIIATANAPPPIGPYPNWPRLRQLIVTSGQIPIDPATGNLVEGGHHRPDPPIPDQCKGCCGGGRLNYGSCG